MPSFTTTFGVLVLLLLPLLLFLASLENVPDFGSLLKLDTGVRVTLLLLTLLMKLLLELRLARSGLNFGGSSLGSYIMEPGFLPRLPFPLPELAACRCFAASFRPSEPLSGLGGKG